MAENCFMVTWAEALIGSGHAGLGGFMIEPDVTLNIKGEVCPYTFVKSKLALEKMDAGKVLKIIVDHKPATENVPGSMKNEGHKILEVEKINDTDWHILIEKRLKSTTIG